MDRWDVLALLGTALLGTGLALLAPWLGIAAAGLVLLALAAAGAAADNRTAADEPEGEPAAAADRTEG
ncbi:hypothetical protein ACWEFL_15795 [Streptomyces sp. NPDC004838]